MPERQSNNTTLRCLANVSRERFSFGFKLPTDTFLGSANLHLLIVSSSLYKDTKIVRELDHKKTIDLLNTIMEFELAGVVRYTHYSLMVTGPNRIPIVEFFKLQANESLTHAQQVGEILTGLEGHPTLRIAPMEETYKHTVRDILEESLSHEKKALDLYKTLLDTVENASIYLEEFTRTMIGTEEMHNIEIKKMLRDFS